MSVFLRESVLEFSPEKAKSWALEVPKAGSWGGQGSWGWGKSFLAMSPPLPFMNEHLCLHFSECIYLRTLTSVSLVFFFLLFPCLMFSVDCERFISAALLWSSPPLGCQDATQQKEHRRWRQADLGSNLISEASCCVTCGKLLDLSESWFTSPWDGIVTKPPIPFLHNFPSSLKVSS